MPIHPDTPGYTANDWLEISITVSGEIAEAVAEVLSKYAFQGVLFEPAQAVDYPDYDDPNSVPFEVLDTAVRVIAYLPTTADLEEKRQRLEHDLWPLQMIARAANLEFPTPVYTPVAQRDWGELWKQHYRPLEIGERLMVVPAWEDPQVAGERIAILMDPGQAFGTGTHPSTQLCMRALEQTVQPGMKVLDLGCGSGILAITAAKLGARQIDGFDIEAQSVKSTLENATRNGVQTHITATQGSVTEAIAAGPYDLAVVNILAKVIILLFGQGLANTLHPGAKMVLAGILDEQAAEVIATAEQAGLVHLSTTPQTDWVGIVVQKPA
jgi:ribosomal protein L11 methyltransferase